jgi:hypothetical protein
MEEKEDAGANPFWALGGAGDRRDGGNGGRRELSGWPDRAKRNRRMARTRCWASGNTRARERGEREGTQSRTWEWEKLHVPVGLEIWRAACLPLMPSDKTGKALALF